MAGPSRKIGNPTGWREAAGGPPPQIGPRRRWQPGDDSGPRRSGRWAKILAVLGGLAVVAAGLGFLYTLVLPPDPPRLVVVGLDPKAVASRLDVPPDYAGWTTGKQLIAWGKAEEKAAGKSSLTAQVVSDGDNPEALTDDLTALGEWAGKLAGRRSATDGRVILYVGLHGGVGPDGSPFLWVDRDGRRLKVSDLFAALADKLQQRDVIVLLDPGRLGPDPQVGRLADNFADRLTKDEGVKTALDKHPRMVAVCGVSSGEVAWESEDLQVTAFGLAVLRGLRGEGTSATGAIYAHELFDFLKETTVAWSEGNRPGRQTPLLLPAGDAGVTRARGMVAAYRTAAPQPLPAPDRAIDPGSLQKLWQSHDELAGQPVPPASYAPLAWRRGRELLVRYQQAVRAGERGAAGVLEQAVKAEFDRVKAASLAAVDKSRTNSVPLAEFTRDPAAEDDKEFRKVSEADGLKLLNVTKLRTLGDNRPAEFHLACMVEDFYSKRAAGPVPAGWVTALNVRRAAERAAFGGGPFGERAWPAVKDDVIAADAKRREGEDQLFATAPAEQAKATAALKEAATGYEKATAAGLAVRDGSAVRDRLFADLPFLGRWAAVSGDAAATQATVSAWAAAHKLADALAAPGPGLAAATSDARTAGDKARQLFDAAAARLANPPASQAAWQDHEHLLASPFVPAAVRMKAIEASRAQTAERSKSSGAAGVGDTAGRVAQAKETARVLARLTAAALGPTLLDRNGQADDQLPRPNQLDARLNDLAEARDDWADKAAGLGHHLLGHLKKAAENAAPKEYPSAAAVDEAERFSRSVVLLAENRTREPAEVAAGLRWQALLVGLADRTARDHWYDEGQQPYWQRAADRYLADAQTARKPDPTVAGAPAVPAAYPDAPKLAIRPADGTPNPLPWTSQRRRGIGFQVSVPADFPKDATGQAVGWRASPAGAAVGWEADAARSPLAVEPSRGGTLDGTLVLRDGLREDVTDTVTPTALVYFRGQRPDGRLTVNVNRKPDRVIREPLPTRREAAVAVRAEPDVPLGQVAILLDYSGSMKYGATDGAVYKTDYATKDSKFRRAQEALRAVLGSLPRGTPLTVRLFSAKVDGNEFSGQVFPEPGGTAEVTWDTTEDDRYKKLVDRLNGYEPFFFTPLADQIAESVKNDFARSGPLVSAKTLVVLTDGVDERQADGDGPTRAANIRKRITEPGGLTVQLQNLFAGEQGKNVALYVVPFGQDKDDEALSKELFKGIDTFDQPGRLFPPVEGSTVLDLKKKLLAAIFPKLRLKDTVDGREPKEIDRTGLPSRLDSKRQPPYSNANGGRDLLWSPWVPAGSYLAQPYPSPSRGPRLTLSESDTIVLGFARDARGGVVVRRELHAEYFEQIPSVTKRQAGGRWVLTSPWPVVEKQRFDATVFVEKVPLHKRTPPDLQQVDIAADPPDPDADGREVLWFDVLPADTAKPQPAGRLTVTRMYGRAAPAWKLERDEWSGPDPRGRVRAVVATTADGLPEPKRLKLKVPRSGEPEAVQKVDGNTKDDELEVRVAVEPKSPEGQEEAGVGWLLVRISHPAGRPVYARLVDDRLKRTANTHRYYPATAGGPRAEYTAAFRVPAAELESLGEVRVNLADVGWAIGEARRDALAITLDPAAPKVDRRSEPAEITPASAGDR